MAHEDDAERAVRAGLRIAEEMAGYGSEVAKGWGIDGFAVRVGVNTGSVVLGPVGGGSRVEYGATGDPINTAARLQKAAAPGTVLVGESDVPARRDRSSTGSGPEQFELKGKQDAVTAYRATGVRAVPGRARGVLGLETPFVGRDEQLAAAREAADAVLGGTGGILFITGEAGIGKSRLSAEVRGLVEAAESPRGAPLWLEGRCVSYGESLPYWPYRDVLREWLGVSLQEPELRLRISLRREVERLFGERVLEIYPYLGAMLGLTLEAEAASRLAELSPEAVQYRTFEVVGELIARLADERPVVLAIDDLHWADATSLQLTEQLLGLSDTAAVLIVIKHRTEPDHPSWRVKTIAAEQYPHRSRELALRALSGDAHRELLVSLFGEGTIPQHLEQQILEGAEGNPFYLEELVGTLAETGVLVRDGDGWRFDHEAKIVIPPTVEKVILARIDRLSARDRDVLTAASVSGTALRAAAARGRDGRGRVAPGVAERAPARRPDPRGAPLARAGVPVQARADPGGRVQDAARRGSRGAPPQGDALARGALRREPRRGARPARVPRTGRERRGRGGPLPDARRRPRPPRMGARRGDRPLPRAASAARAPRRRPGDRARPPEARDRAPHLAAIRRGERDVPAGLPVLGAARLPGRRPRPCA